MKGIGGNITATIQISSGFEANAIGEQVKTWENAQTLRGWLDMASGNSGYGYHAKIQESTHYFIADYVPLDARITAENSRMVINGKRYDVLMIDNPMGMGSGSQLEIYLKFTGGQ